MRSAASGARARVAGNPLAALAYLLFALVALASSYVRADVAPDSLHPGQAGFALTAGPGNRVERFPITVLGVLEDGGPGFPLVLVRAEGPFIERSGGVAAGMSGSPVYLPVDGRDELLGAIGHVFPQSDHRVALVTPIAAMRSTNAAAAPTSVAPWGPAVPVSFPVALSGLSPRGAVFLEPALGRENPLVPVQGGTTTAADAPYVLEPGSAISVQLVRGDLSVAAVGTVTAVEGDRILAFGHPLLNTGEASLPFGPAFVTAIVASTVVPFKLANSGREILGTITQDRPAAIAGTTGAEPRLVPVSVVVGGVGGGRSFAFEVVPDEALVAPLIATAALAALDRTMQSVGPGTAGIAWEVRLADGPPVRMLDQVADASDVALSAARAIGGPIQILADNPFTEARLTSVAVHVDLTRDLDVGDLVDLRAERDEAAPGDDVVVHARLQPHRRDPRVESLTVTVPDDASGALVLRVRGGNEPTDDSEGVETEPPVLSFSELLGALEQDAQGSELVVEWLREDGVRRLERRTLPFVVTGSRELTIEVTAPADPGSGTDGHAAAGAAPPDDVEPRRREGPGGAPP